MWVDSVLVCANEFTMKLELKATRISWNPFIEAHIKKDKYMSAIFKKCKMRKTEGKFDLLTLVLFLLISLD